MSLQDWANADWLRPYRTTRDQIVALQSLPLILGTDWQDDADYMETCRSKRNKTEYDAVGQVTRAQAKELADFAKRLRKKAISWLKEKHPDLSV
jgi:hypothetical protein